MKWWEGYSGVNCTFALDYNSIIEGNKLFFSNDPSRFLEFSNQNIKALNGTTSGFELQNSKFESLDVIKYKSLNISNTDLTFDIPQQIENEFTLILKCRVNQSTVFLCNNTSDYGPTFGVGLHNNTVSTGPDDWVWSCSGFLPSENKTPNKSTFDIKTLVIKGNMNSKEVYFYTEYGVIKVPTNSSAFTSGFLVPRTYSTLGYTLSDRRWSINSDIIAYGIFDKILTEEQVTDLKNKLDLEFKISRSKNQIFKKDLFYNPISLKNKLKVKLQTLNTLENTFQATKSIRSFVEESISEHSLEGNQHNILYKNTKTITDIVLEEGLPIVTKLYLYERYTGELLKVTSSNSKGQFTFLDLKEDIEYIIRASDNKYQFQSILKDYN